MQNNCKFSGIALLAILIISCNKATNVLLPIVTTTQAKSVLYTTVTLGGTVLDDGGETVARGVCVDTETGPTVDKFRTSDGFGEGEFTTFLYGLNPGSTYYVRAYASNRAGTEYGSEISFTTHTPGIVFNPSLTYGSLLDISGKTYKTIVIGPQVWMAENLKTEKLNDGTAIPLVSQNGEWSNNVVPAYCWFQNNDSVYENIYGAYYNWFAVNTGKLCPVGWHVPGDSEWQLLIDYLGGTKAAGSKVKVTGTNDWVFSNTDATNSSGFSALPAGLREGLDGTFGGNGLYGGWWSSTEIATGSSGTSWCRWVHGDTTVFARTQIYKKDGFSVRCVKD